MRAWQFTSTHGGLEKHLVLNPAAPLPPHDAKALGHDKILVQVAFAALNPADFKIAELPIAGRVVVRRPATPGMDFAGRIVALGADEGKGMGQSDGDGSGLKVGQMVFGRLDQPSRFGTLAEYIVARKAGVAVLPAAAAAASSGASVGLEAAAGVGTAGLTAYQCIAPNVGRGSGEKVFINGGSGGTGTFGIQIAKALGCHVVTSCSAKNVELCKSLGADEVVDYTQGDLVEALSQMSHRDEQQQGVKFDLVVDNVGNLGKLYWQSHRFTSDRAKFVQVGAPMAVSSAADMAAKLLWPRFLGGGGGGKRKFQFLNVQGNAAQLEEIGMWMAEGKVHTVIDQVFAMEDAPKAFEKLRTQRTKGKIVVAVSDVNR